MGGGGEAGFRFMGIVMGSAITLFCLLCFWGTRKARTLPPKDEMPHFGEQIKVAVKNFPFLMLMSMYLLQSVGIGVLMAGLIYYIKYVLNLPETDMGMIFGVLFITAILFIPVWVQIGKKFGKIRAYKYGLVLLSIMLVTIFFSSPSYLILFYIQVFFLGIGFSSFQLFPFSMLPDTVEYDEMQSGMRREGIFCGVWAAGQKTAYSLGPAIVGFALSLAGFVKGSEIQPDTVAVSVRIVFSLFTSFMLIISLIPFSKYELTEERFDEIKRLISKKAKR
jgi:Na+/melibiose symporter-like transporter